MIAHMTDYVTVETTTKGHVLAGMIARAAIENRIAACARVYSVDSVYRWQGEIETSQEFAVELKTTVAKSGDAQALIRKMHTYNLPEIVVRPIIGGSEDYLDWVADEVS